MECLLYQPAALHHRRRAPAWVRDHRPWAGDDGSRSRRRSVEHVLLPSGMLGLVVMNRLAVPWLIVVLLLGGGAQMQTPPPRTPIDVSNVGPHVGETVPNFSL